MKQSISGSVAAIAIVLALGGSLLIFNRAKLAPDLNPPVVLPPEPPVDDQELSQLPQPKTTYPLGANPATWHAAHSGTSRHVAPIIANDFRSLSSKSWL